MKKSILFLSLLFIGVSCESDDNSKPDPGDPLFESEYTPLKSLNELNSTYVYYGAKIGSRPFGAIASSNCLSKNTFSTFITGSNDFFSKDSIVFQSYLQDKVKGECAVDFIRTLRKVKLVEEGKMYADIHDFSYEEVKVNYKDEITGEFLDSIRIDTIKNVYFEGNLDIGVQGGYLRVEDKFSRYNGKDKVYQYFKKR